MSTQLSPYQIKAYADMLKVKQKYKCPMCGCSLSYGRTALDHSHTTGMIRAVLCNQCNRSEGKVRFGMRYMAKSNHLVRTNPVAWLKNLVTYLEYHHKNPSKVFHPSFDVRLGKQKPVTKVKAKRKCPKKKIVKKVVKKVVKK
jgi:hypothetical protein